MTDLAHGNGFWKEIGEVGIVSLLFLVVGVFGCRTPDVARPTPADEYGLESDALLRILESTSPYLTSPKTIASACDHAPTKVVVKGTKNRESFYWEDPSGRLCADQDFVVSKAILPDECHLVMMLRRLGDSSLCFYVAALSGERQLMRGSIVGRLSRSGGDAVVTWESSDAPVCEPSFHEYQ